jgi:hypothetical protein
MVKRAAPSLRSNIPQTWTPTSLQFLQLILTFVLLRAKNRKKSQKKSQKISNKNSIFNIFFITFKIKHIKRIDKSQNK